LTACLCSTSEASLTRVRGGGTTQVEFWRDNVSINDTVLQCSKEYKVSLVHRAHSISLCWV
jgi:hypothetical protein